MNYISLSFFVFVSICLILYYLFPVNKRWLILLCGSVVFSFFNCKWFVFPLFLFGIIIWYSGILLSKCDSEYEDKKINLNKNEKKRLKAVINKKKNRILFFTILISIINLVVFKYFSVILTSFIDIENSKINILVPVGISYYTLMGIGYLIDVYRKNIDIQKNYFKLLLYLSFFPYIVEGPIGRYDKLSLQLYNGNRFEYNNFSQGLYNILIGLSKKLIIADRLSIIVNEIFDNYNTYSGIIIAFVIVIYVVQIYADFSGCIDIVIGVSRLFGIKLAPNFNQPFLSKSIQEFWRRWHITLGVWLRDYIFYPVSLSKPLLKYSRKEKNKYFRVTVPALIANFAVWMTMGVWHGVSLKFIVYGLYYFTLVGFGVACKPFFDKSKKLEYLNSTKFFKLFQLVRTWIVVAIGMFLFRADSLKQFLSMIYSLFKVNFDISVVRSNFDKYDIGIIVFGVLLWGFISLLKEYKNIYINDLLVKKPLCVRWIVYFSLIIIISLFGKYGPEFDSSQFIYGGF